jgi:hypothetical protein
MAWFTNGADRRASRFSSIKKSSDDSLEDSIIKEEVFQDAAATRKALAHCEGLTRSGDEFVPHVGPVIR